MLLGPPQTQAGLSGDPCHLLSQVEECGEWWCWPPLPSEGLGLVTQEKDLAPSWPQKHLQMCLTDARHILVPAGDTVTMGREHCALPLPH